MIGSCHHQGLQGLLALQQECPLPSLFLIPLPWPKVKASNESRPHLKSCTANLPCTAAMAVLLATHKRLFLKVQLWSCHPPRNLQDPPTSLENKAQILFQGTPGCPNLAPIYFSGNLPTKPKIPSTVLYFPLFCFLIAIPSA